MGALNTADGITLHLAEWPAPPAARGTVLIVHGLGEHVGRYGHVVDHLQRAGWAVAGYDQRGHGQSGGPRGGIAFDDALLRDLSAVLAHVRAGRRAVGHGPGPGPLVLLGHSLGGLVVGRFVAEGLSPTPAPWWRPVDALVMSSPALDPGMNALQKLLLAVMGRLAPDVAVNNGLKPEWISRDPAVVRAYVADAQVHDRVSARLVRWLVASGALVRERAPHWAQPTLLLYAGADRCVAPAGSAAFAAAAPQAVVTVQRYDGLAHEIFNEPEQARALAELSRWLAGLAPH